MLGSMLFLVFVLQKLLKEEKDRQASPRSLKKRRQVFSALLYSQ